MNLIARLYKFTHAIVSHNKSNKMLQWIEMLPMNLNNMKAEKE